VLKNAFKVSKGFVPVALSASQKENLRKDFFDLTRVALQDILPVCRWAVIPADAVSGS
jgi:hypothetical protein